MMAKAPGICTLGTCCSHPPTLIHLYQTYQYRVTYLYLAAVDTDIHCYKMIKQSCVYPSAVGWYERPHATLHYFTMTFNLRH